MDENNHLPFGMALCSLFDSQDLQKIILWRRNERHSLSWVMNVGFDQGY